MKKRLALELNENDRRTLEAVGLHRRKETRNQKLATNNWERGGE
jgi:hypothetical protein